MLLHIAKAYSWRTQSGQPGKPPFGEVIMSLDQADKKKGELLMDAPPQTSPSPPPETKPSPPRETKPPPTEAKPPPPRTKPSPPGTKTSPLSPFTIKVVDKNGTELPIDSMGFSDPGAREARGLEFDVHVDAQPTTADMELYRELSKVEHALQELYPETNPASEAKFRPYFVRLFYLAQLILEGDVSKAEDGTKMVGGRLPTDAAKAEVIAITNDLIDAEAPRIKNGHLRDLASCASKLSLPFLAAYVGRGSYRAGHMRIDIV